MSSKPLREFLGGQYNYACNYLFKEKSNGTFAFLELVVLPDKNKKVKTKRLKWEHLYATPHYGYITMQYSQLYSTLEISLWLRSRRWGSISCKSCLGHSPTATT